MVSNNLNIEKVDLFLVVNTDFVFDMFVVVLDPPKLSHYQAVILGFVSRSIFEETSELEVGDIICNNCLVHLITIL